MPFLGKLTTKLMINELKVSNLKINFNTTVLSAVDYFTVLSYLIPLLTIHMDAEVVHEEL